MTPTEQFTEREKEINLYFDFLRTVVVDGALLTSSSGGPSPIDLELQKILKANAVVLLYNLVESSMRNGITYIHDNIVAGRYAYNVLRKELQLIWLEHWIPVDKGRPADASSQKLHGLIQKIVKDEVANFDSERMNMQGNLDAQKIRTLCKRYGFSHVTPRVTKGGYLLLEVKKGRNDLAHGRKSFAEYGRDLTFPNLEAMKTQVVLYLEHILKNIENFVERKEYVVSKIKAESITV